MNAEEESNITPVKPLVSDICVHPRLNPMGTPSPKAITIHDCVKPWRPAPHRSRNRLGCEPGGGCRRLPAKRASAAAQPRIDFRYDAWPLRSEVKLRYPLQDAAPLPLIEPAVPTLVKVAAPVDDSPRAVPVQTRLSGPWLPGAVSGPGQDEAHGWQAHPRMKRNTSDLSVGVRPLLQDELNSPGGESFDSHGLA